MEEIVIYKNQNQIEALQMLLNQNPSKEEVRVNKMANDSEYLPINAVERLLDELFQGLWQVENFNTQVVANEIVGSIDLKVFHPTAKQWLTRVGAASVMIQTAKDQAVTIENKIKNTLVKDYPHLKAECIKNAAKSLGVRFGRNLNRGKDDHYNYLSGIAAEVSELGQQAIELVETANIADHVKDKYRAQIARANNETLKLYIKDLNKRQL